MDFNEAKLFLRDEYIKNGFELVKEDAISIVLKYDNYYYKIIEEDIKKYADFKSKGNNFKKNPNECSLMTDNYREQVIYNLGDKHFLLFYTKYQFVDVENSKIMAEVSSASEDFINEFRLDREFLKSSIAVLEKDFFKTFLSQNTNEMFAKDIRSEFKAPVTIKIFNINKSDENKITHSDKIINSCLFSLAYFENLPLGIRDKWLDKSVNFKEFDIKKKFDDTSIPLPKIKYNEDLIMFYKEALCTSKTVLKFLAYYHILEYHFTKVTYAKLFKKMRSVIKNPEFTSSDEDLNNLLISIKEQKIPDAELKCLENVIEENVDKTELQKFLKGYDDKLGEKHYSSEIALFGQKIKINDPIELVAKIIYTVRNAIVHSDDLNNSKIKHIPFSESEKEILMEIPLIRFLAEKVIIATSKNI
jgi:hypothetical protein